MAEEFEKQFTCLGQNTGKHIIFIVPIEKDFTRTGKSDQEITKK